MWATGTAIAGSALPSLASPASAVAVAWPAAAPAAGTAPTASAQPAPAGEDSLNLVKLVGPAILKRVIPVVIAVGGLAVLARLLFRRRDKD